jgi:hypothetical protein
MAPEARKGAHYFGPHIAQELRASVGVRIHYKLSIERMVSHEVHR